MLACVYLSPTIPNLTWRVQALPRFQNQVEWKYGLAMKRLLRIRRQSSGECSFSGSDPSSAKRISISSAQ